MNRMNDDLLYPFALGCLTPEEIEAFRKQIDQKGDINFQELGEFQNLVALLPAILNVEIPLPQLKDKVARKLYRVKDEVRKIRPPGKQQTGEVSKTPGSFMKITRGENQPQETPPSDEHELFDQSAPEAEFSFEAEPEQNLHTTTEMEEPESERTFDEMPPPEPEQIGRRYTIENPPPHVETSKRVEAEHEEEKPVIEKKVIEIKPRRTSEFFRPPQATQIRGRDTSNFYKPYNPEKQEDAFQDRIELPEDKFEEDLSEPVPLPTSIKETEEPVDERQLTEEEIVDNIMRETIDLTDERTRSYKGPTPPSTDAPVKKNYTLMVGGFLLFFIVVLGIIFAYIRITSQVDDYQKQVENLNQKINSLSMQLSSSQEIQQMLQSPDVTVVNLKGTNLNTSGYGKLLISPGKGNGYIQLAQMPALPENRIYQLWLGVSGSFMNLGTFTPTETVGYYSFKLPTMPTGYDVSFLVTEEPDPGSKNPGSKVFLTGNL